MTFSGMITSPDNTKVKYARSLHKKRVRYREKRYLIEGLRLVAHALQRGRWPALVFHTEAFAATERGSSLVQRLVSREDTAVWCVTPRVMKVICDTVSPQGVVGIVSMQEASAALAHRATLLLILDSIRDPGNLGTILRTAQATCVEAVVLSHGCADAYSPKVVRASMGAHFDLPLFHDATWPTIEKLVIGKHCVLADADGQLTPWEFDWAPPVALIVGSEAHGASAEARAMAQLSLRLPMAEGAESLNAAIVAAVMLFEAQRQRRWPSQVPGAD